MLRLEPPYLPIQRSGFEGFEQGKRKKGTA
jgi:hypothetical protein